MISENKRPDANANAEQIGEIDLRELIEVIWSAKLTIVSITVAASLISVLVALALPDKYKAEALLAPRAGGGAGGGLAQMASQFGGLASIAGVNIGGLGSQSSTAVAIELLKSREFFSKYLYEQVLVDLMASEGWDRSSGDVVVDEKIFDSKSNTWVREVAEQFEVKPSAQEAHERFASEFLNVIENKKTGFVTIVISHYSPTVARDWVALIVESINQAVRAREVQEAQKSIAFLNEQGRKTNLVSLQEVFGKLIEEQTKTVMLANATDEYVFQVIEPPVAPERKSEPRRAVICILGTLFGGLVALVLTLTQYFVRKKASFK